MKIQKCKQSRKMVISFIDTDRPWETTTYMIEQEQKRRDQSSFNYGYNNESSKVERIP